MTNISVLKSKKDFLRPLPEKMKVTRNSLVFSAGKHHHALVAASGMHVVSITVKPQASVVVTISRNFDPSAVCKLVLQVKLARDAHLELKPKITGGSRIETQLIVDFNGKGSDCKISGSMHGGDSAHHGIGIAFMHNVPNTSGIIALRGVYEQDARANVNGIISIAQKAHGTTSYFKDDILLFDSAMAVSVPTLEIKANDVKASHGSTTSRINDEQLIYAESRGFAPHEARQLIIDGFLNTK